MIEIDVNKLGENILFKKELIKEYESQKDFLVKTYQDKMCPQGYKTGTSYWDCDTIKGSKEEYRIDDLMKEIDKINIEIERIRELIELDKKIISNRLEEETIDNYIRELKTTKEKVKFLRGVCKMSIKDTAEKLCLTPDAVSKASKKLRQEGGL